MGGLAHFGGDSSSATTNKTDVRDMRVVGGDNSTNTSTSFGDVRARATVTLTDHGAVRAGLDLGTKALDANAAAVSTSLAAAGDMFTGALDTVKDSNQRLALAYQSGQTGEQTMLKYAGFIVVGLAAVTLLKR